MNDTYGNSHQKNKQDFDFSDSLEVRSLSHRTFDMFPVKPTDIRKSILQTAAFLLRELSSSEYTSIDIDADDPSSARMRLLAEEIANALDAIKF